MDRVEAAVRAVLLVVVGGIGAAVGFHHTVNWAEENWQDAPVSYGVGVVVESMAVVAGFELRRKPGAGPLLVLVGSFLLQMAAQVATARPTVAGWLLAAVPALGFLVIVKLAMRRVATPTAAPVSVGHAVQVERVDVDQEPPRVIAAQERPASPQPQSTAVVTAWPPK